VVRRVGLVRLLLVLELVDLLLLGFLQRVVLRRLLRCGLVIHCRDLHRERSNTSCSLDGRFGLAEDGEYLQSSQNCLQTGDASI
jgi:hypothetical protein